MWHDDVIYFDVARRRGRAFIGGIYFDLYPREGKFPHAAAWPVRGVRTRAGRTPISVLVANFDRRGLTHDEVETLFHEFGHILHGVLSETSTTSTPARACSATSSKRRRRFTRSGRAVSKACERMRAGVARHAGDGCRPRRAARSRRGASARASSTRGSGSTRRSTWRSPARRQARRCRCGSGWKAPPCSATSAAPPSRAPSPHRRRLRGWLLRLHVGRGHRPRHAVGVRRHV